MIPHETGTHLMTNNSLVVGQLLAAQNASSTWEALPDLGRLALPLDRRKDFWEVEELLRAAPPRYDTHTFARVLSLLFNLMAHGGTVKTFGYRQPKAAEQPRGTSSEFSTGGLPSLPRPSLSVFGDCKKVGTELRGENLNSKVMPSFCLSRELLGADIASAPIEPLACQAPQRIRLGGASGWTPTIGLFDTDTVFDGQIRVVDVCKIVSIDGLDVIDGKVADFAFASGHTMPAKGWRKIAGIMSAEQTAVLCFSFERERYPLDPFGLDRVGATVGGPQAKPRITHLSACTTLGCNAADNGLELDVMSKAISGYIASLAQNENENEEDAKTLDHPQLSMRKAVALTKGKALYDEAFYEPGAQTALAELSSVSHRSNVDDSEAFPSDRLITPRLALSVFLGRDLPKCDQLG